MGDLVVIAWLVLGCWPGPLPPCDDCALHDDVDGDGFTPAGGDCDDADPDVRPDAREICNDGIDNDCDGSAGACVHAGAHPLSEADARITSAVADQRAGATLAVDADAGHLVVGLPGWVLGSGGVARLASALPTGDVALDEVTVAAVDSRLLLAGLGEQLAVGPAGVVVQESTGIVPRYGSVHLLRHDFPTASVRDVAVVSLEGVELGLRLVMGPAGELLLSSGEAKVSAQWVPQPGSGAGYAILGPRATAVAVGDLDGDGALDLAVANDLEDEGTESAVGRIWVFYGPVDGDRDTASADRVYAGTQTGDRAGGTLALLPDLDGDGRPELAVASPRNGLVWLLDATVESGPLDERSWLRLVGPPSFGATLAAPDLDRDDARELAVAAPDASETAEEAGSVYVFRGPVGSGLVEAASAELVLLGVGSGHAAGSALVVWDVDGDEHDDLVVGAPGESTRASDGGGLYVWRGRGL